MDNEVAITKQVIEVLQSTGSEAIASYALWHAKSAVAWICFGFFAGVVSIASFFYGWIQDSGEAFVLAAVLLLIGALCFAVNFPTLHAPEAYAIHQLIIDVRG